MFRLFTRGCVEERLLTLAEKRRPLEPVLRPGPARSSAGGARLLEEVLRWGAAELFAPPGGVSGNGGAGAADVPGAGDQTAAVKAEGGGAKDGGDAAINDAPGAGAAGGAAAAPRAPGAAAPPPLTDAQVAGLLPRAAAACAGGLGAVGGDAATAPQAAGAPGAGAVGSLGAGLGDAALVREWPDVDRSVEDDAGAYDGDDDDGGDDGGEEEDAAGGAGPGGLPRSDSSAATALYWEGILRSRWGRGRRQEVAGRAALWLQPSAARSGL